MGKFYTIEINKSQPFYFRYINEESVIKFIKSDEDFENKLIYFLTKGKKLRFDLSSAKLNENSISLDLLVGENKRVATSTDFFENPPEGVKLKLDLKNSTNKELVIDGYKEPIYIIPEWFRIVL